MATTLHTFDLNRLPDDVGSSESTASNDPPLVLHVSEVQSSAQKGARQKVPNGRKGKPWTEARHEAQRQMAVDGRRDAMREKLSRARKGKPWTEARHEAQRQMALDGRLDAIRERGRKTRVGTAWTEARRETERQKELDGRAEQRRIRISQTKTKGEWSLERLGKLRQRRYKSSQRKAATTAAVDEARPVQSRMDAGGGVQSTQQQK